MSKRRNPKYVMFGFRLSDIDNVAYLKVIPTSNALTDYVTRERSEAMIFPERPRKPKTGTPKQWLDFANSEAKRYFGDDAFKFHLIKISD